MIYIYIYNDLQSVYEKGLYIWEAQNDCIVFRVLILYLKKLVLYLEQELLA